MDALVVEQLLAINRKFYSEFARPFSDTRSSRQTRLDRIVAYIGDGVKVLDVGCGNGRLAERIEKEGRRVEYLGVDASPELIAVASARKANLHRVMAEFLFADLADPDWTRSISKVSYDIVLAVAVLHHIPSFELRCAILRGIYAILRPGGQFIMTNWHFERNDRLRKKIVPWESAGFDPRMLETGDALLTWERGGIGYRFCHLLTIPEVLRMGEMCGFRIVKQYYADADLNLYSVLERPE